MSKLLNNQAKGIQENHERGCNGQIDGALKWSPEWCWEGLDLDTVWMTSERPFGGPRRASQGAEKEGALRIEGKKE